MTPKSNQVVTKGIIFDTWQPRFLFYSVQSSQSTTYFPETQFLHCSAAT